MVGFPKEKKIDLKIGDKVEITYTGIVMETYPVQIDVMKIEKVEESN